MKHNWAQSQHSIRSWLDRDSRPRVPLGPRTWKMLLGLYSASGMFSRNQPAPGPRSEKNEAWDWTRPVFQIHNPKTQHPRHYKSNTTLNKSGDCRHHTPVIHVRSSMVQLSLWWPFTSNKTYMCLVFNLSPILLYSSLPLPFFHLFQPHRDKLSE